MDIKFLAPNATITAANKGYINIQIEDADLGEILSQIPLAEIIEQLGDDTIMDKIGEERVREYFDIEVEK